MQYGGTHHGHYTMNDAAHRLRAQKVYSTDPARRGWVPIASNGQPLPIK
jgi:hypothetical protein